MNFISRKYGIFYRVCFHDARSNIYIRYQCINQVVSSLVNNLESNMDIEETGIRNKLKSNIQHIYSFKDFGNYEGIYTMYMLGLCGIMKLFNQLTCHTCTRFRTDDFGGQNSKGLN